MKHIHYRTGVATVLLASVLPVGAASAQALSDDFWLQASAFKAHVDTDVTVSSNTNPTVGTEIDLEDDLGFDDDEWLPAVAAGARLGSDLSLMAEYYSLARDTTATLARDITIEDVTYPVNGSVTAGFDTDIYRLVLGWAFVRKPNLEVGAALGVHATTIDLGIEGEGVVGGVSTGAERRQQDFLAPLPTLGLFTSFEPTPGLTLGARIDYLSLKIDDYKGRLINTQATASYRVLRNVGVGVMYRYVDYRVDVEKDRYTGRFAYKFNGPAIFLEIGF